MLVADLSFTTPHHLLRALASPEIQYSIKLSLISCTLTTLLSLWVAVPTGYLMSRHRFPGKRLMDAILDIPIVLPPLVIGLSLLILFQTPRGPGHPAGRAGDLRHSQRHPGAIRRGVRLRGADHAGDVRPDQPALRAGRADAGLQSQPGVLAGGVAGGAARGVDGGDAGLGARAGRVWPDPGLLGRDPHADGGAADDACSWN